MKVNTDALMDGSANIRDAAFRLRDVSERIEQVNHRLMDASLYRLMHHALHLEARKVSELSDCLWQMGVALSLIAETYREAEVHAIDETERLPSSSDLIYVERIVPETIEPCRPDWIGQLQFPDGLFGEPSGAGGGGSW